MLNFDEPRLRMAVEKVPTELRGAFGLSCAERLFPAYVKYAKETGRGTPDVLRSILDRQWAGLLRAGVDINELQADLEVCMGLLPNEDDGNWVPAQAEAEDAVASLAYAIRARLHGHEMNEVWAARRAYEAADHSVLSQDDTITFEEKRENLILSNPLVQVELEHQWRDIQELGQATSDSSSEVIRRVMDRARKR